MPVTTAAPAARAGSRRCTFQLRLAARARCSGFSVAPTPWTVATATSRWRSAVRNSGRGPSAIGTARRASATASIGPATGSSVRASDSSSRLNSSARRVLVMFIDCPPSDGATTRRPSRWRAISPNSPIGLARSSEQVLWEQARQRLHRAVLQRLDGTFVLPHDRRGLRDRHALEEAQRDAFLLLGPERLHRFEQRFVGDRGQDLVLRALLAAVGAGLDEVGGGDLQPVAAGLEVVGDEVARDGHQPGAEVTALPRVGGDPA